MKKIFLFALLLSGFFSQTIFAEAMTPGKSLTETTVEVEINASIEKVWAEFANIGNIYLSSPTVAKSNLSSEKQYGIGATRHMEMSKMIKKGAELDERVIAWEEGNYMKMEVYKIYKVSGIKTMGGDFKLIEKNGKTILRSTLNYSMVNGMWGLMNNMMGRKKFAKVWKSVIAGYKYHIETGKQVTEDTELDLDTVKLISIEKVKS
jgi:hypothetical protein